MHPFYWVCHLRYTIRYQILNIKTNEFIYWEFDPYLVSQCIYLELLSNWEVIWISWDMRNHIYPELELHAWCLFSDIDDLNICDTLCSSNVTALYITCSLVCYHIVIKKDQGRINFLPLHQCVKIYFMHSLNATSSMLKFL